MLADILPGYSVAQMGGKRYIDRQFPSTSPIRLADRQMPVLHPLGSEVSSLRRSV